MIKCTWFCFPMLCDCFFFFLNRAFFFFLNRASFSTNQKYNRNQLARTCFPALDAIYSSSSSEWFSVVCICCDWQEQLLCFRALNAF